MLTNLSLCAPPCAKKLRINLCEEWWWAGDGIQCMSHPLPTPVKEPWLWWWNPGQTSERCCPSLQVSLPLLCSPGWEKPLSISRAACVGRWFLHNFEGDRRLLSLLPKGTLRRWISEKTQTHQPLAAGVQVCALASSEGELQEGRYWLLLPLGNTGDRLKSRGKKVISQLVCPEQEKVPDTNKLINAESSWGQAFPSLPLFFWFFLTG